MGKGGGVEREFEEVCRRVRELEGIEEELRVSRDEVRRVEGLLSEACVERERAAEREKRFIEEVSHSFFNPLCVAKGYLVLLEGKMSRDEQRRDLEAAKRAIERIESMLIDVVCRGRGFGVQGRKR